MTHDEAIESLMNSCEEFTNMIEQLKTQNAFLTDTIEKSNLGEIAKERKTLLSQVQKAEEETTRLKKEYESKLAELNKKISEVKYKESDLDSYINKEIAKRTADLEAAHIKDLQEKKDLLIQYKADYESLLVVQREVYEAKMATIKRLIAIMVIIALAVAFKYVT